MSNVIYTVDFAPRVEQQLNLIPKDTRKLIFERIDKLKKNPRPENIEPLHGIDKGLFRIRQGDYLSNSLQYSRSKAFGINCPCSS